MENMEFEFKKITTDENLERFSELMYSCFNLKLDASFFKWKYFDNPAGHAIAYEALYNGKTVSSYVIIPELYWIDGAVKKIYQSVDTMTHPDFQRKGLFVKLAQMAFQDALIQDKELLIIGFPGSQSYGGFVNKLNWKLLHNANYTFLPNILFTIRNCTKANNTASIIKFNEVTDMLSNYLQTIQPHTMVSKVFNKEIFYWETFNNPRSKYNVIGIIKNSEPLGVCVYEVDYKNTCLISWLHFKDKLNYKIHTSDFLQYIFKETKIKYIYTWNAQAPILSEAYTKCGFLTNPFKKGPFHSKIPFIIYEQGFSKDSVIGIFENYDFQPIMLD